jgi:hypothetical protein
MGKTPVITQDDIDAFKEDAEIYDRVNSRIESGVPQHREMRAEEVLPFWRHSRRVQGWLALALDELDRRNADAMTHGEPEDKYID